MPHAEEVTMSNGEPQPSKLINHVTSYPVVSDGIEAYKSNPYGAKTLEVADATYSKFGKPLEPYLRTPYSYAKPYVEKADSLADSSLNKVDSHFPIIKEDTNTIKDTVLNYALFPLHLTGQTYRYVLDTWSDEYQKTIRRNNRGHGVTSSVLAIISTELKIASDALQVASEYLGGKTDEAKKKRDDYVKTAQDKANSFSASAKQNKDSYASQAQQGLDGYASKARQTTDKAANKAKEATS